MSLQSENLREFKAFWNQEIEAEKPSLDNEVLNRLAFIEEYPSKWVREPN